jgi:ribosomal protein S18 acetylase RimI-like enzyme
VSLRRTAETGTDGGPLYRDVVGDLIALDTRIAVVDTSSGFVEVPVDAVAAARLALPSTADELALEAVAARGFRALETEQLGGWLLRAAEGFTGRANSVLPLKAPGMPLDAALARARSWYAQRGLPLRLQIPTEARRLLDAALGEQGWPASPDVHVYAARLDAVADPDPAEVRVEVELAARPDDQWFQLYRGGAGAVPAARAVVTNHDRAVFASVRQDGSTVAIGRGALDDGWVGISAVEVVAERRRRGLATAVVAALCRWGAEAAASRGYLQVSSDNPAGVALYESLGFWRHHDYRCRTEPD